MFDKMQYDSCREEVCWYKTNRKLCYFPKFHYVCASNF